MQDHVATHLVWPYILASQAQKHANYKYALSLNQRHHKSHSDHSGDDRGVYINPSFEFTFTRRDCLHDSEFNVSSYVSFPTEHRAKLHPNSPMKLLNGKFRRTHVV